MSVSDDYLMHMYDPHIVLPPFTPPDYTHHSTIRGSNAIYAIAVSPDSMMIASGDEGGVIQIWDRRSHEKRCIHGDCVVSSVCFSPDSRWLVSASRDRIVRKWDCGTGLAFGSPFLGHTSDVNSVCMDGQRIISGSSDRTIRIWSCDTHELIGAPIDAGSDSVHAVALSKNHIAAAVGLDVCVFDIETRQQVFSMRGHTDCVWTVAFSPDGSRIVTGSWDMSVRIWDVQTRRQTHTLDGHKNHVISVAFSSDGHWVSSGSIDTTVRVWNSQTGQPLSVPLRGSTYVRGVSFFPNTLQLISGIGDQIYIWYALYKWQKPSQQITTIHLSQLPTFSFENISLEGYPSVVSSCCSPDGSFYAASTLEGHVSIWIGERKLLWETNTLIHPIHLLQLSEKQLILSAPDGSTLSWDLLDGKPTNDNAISCGPQINASNFHNSNLSNDTVSWYPFDFDAGLWAYVDGYLISFRARRRIYYHFRFPRSPIDTTFLL